MILLFITAAASLLGALVINGFAMQITNPIEVISGFARLSLQMNPGIAFSISLPSPWQEILILAALGAVVVVAVRSKLDRWSSVSFGLIIGGAVANLVDRFMDGFVTDYFSVGTFPVFNVADSCITVGAILLIIHALLESRKSASKAS